MKARIINTSLATLFLLTGSASAVVTFFSGTSNPGAVTVDGTNVPGRAVFVSTSSDLDSSIPTAFGSILASGGTSSDFDAALGLLLAGGTNPGIVKTAEVTLTGFVSNSSEEVGNPGNRTYLFVVGEAGGSVSGIGAYKGSNVPSFGPISLTPATDTPLLGTSDAGFQLAPVIPEPSVAILGALGALGLLRRRR